MLIAQLSDPHITPPGTKLYNRIETNRHFSEAVERLMALQPRPDVVLITGDLVDRGSESEYSHLRLLLSPVLAAGLPVYFIAGNHDHRESLLAAFPDHPWMQQCPPFIQYVIDDFPVRIIALDSVVPRKPYGELCAARLAWLEQTLAAGGGKPTVVMLHHPPFRTFIEHMDAMGLADAAPLAAIVQRHPEIERVLCGHLHRPIQTRFAGTLASTAPSTAHQVVLTLAQGGVEAMTMEPPAFNLHRWSAETGVVSHTVYVGEYAGPYPFANA